MQYDIVGMVRYFFNVHQNGELIKDPEGTELEVMHALPESPRMKFQKTAIGKLLP